MHFGNQPLFLDAMTHLCNRVVDDLLVRHIALVSYKKLVYALCSVAIDLLKPLLDVIERIHVCHIVDNTNAVCTAIVRGGNGSESLLTCSVPLALMSALRHESHVPR